MIESFVIFVLWNSIFFFLTPNAIAVKLKLSYENILGQQLGVDG